MANFGETLKRERELREISLRQISEATKINIRYLEALEENRFDALPGGLFNKGFIRAYATYIGVDGEAMVNSYLHELSARGPGADSVGAREHPQLHRPMEVPQRRASPRPGDAARAHPAPPGGAAGPVSPKSILPGAPDRRPTPPAAQAPLARHPAAGENPLVDGLERLQATRPAVTGIEIADQATRRSSRVLVWILSLVAGAGALFLVLSLLRGPTPTSPEVAIQPAAAPPIGGPAGPEAKADPVTEGRPAASAGVPVLLPDMSSTSPIALGALDAPRPKTPAGDPSAAPIRVPAAPRGARPAPSPAPGPLPAGKSQPTRGDGRRSSMDVVLEARSRTFVQLLCDGSERANRVMESGEAVRARCFGVVRVSAADAGATSISVNGSPCLPLGDPGTRAYGYTIRIDDYARICPPEGREADDRP